MAKNKDIKPMLNAYPDSIGNRLEQTVSFLKKEESRDIFGSFYILPSFFNTDLDRGFSVIDYNMNKVFASQSDLDDLKELGINLKFDFILNHASVLSEQFQDIVKNGEASKYADFFINWNKFWQGHGKMTEEGYIQPDEELIKDMFFRKPGLPILMVRMPDGRDIPYWNTFYQEVKYFKVDTQSLMLALNLQYLTAEKITDIVNKALDNGVLPKDIDFKDFGEYKKDVVNYIESKRQYLGQMDLNIKSPLVWEYYDNILKTLADYGAKIVRLDAFAYAPKEPGLRNFLNEPGTWDLLEKVNDLAKKYGLTLLPEIHSSYSEKSYKTLSDKGYMTYDFFLPGLIINTLEEKNGEKLADWANEIIRDKIDVVNMLGCHDGIPLLDLKGIVEDEKIEKLIDTVVSRGGYVKNLHGQKNIYYQVNATYYSALGEDDKKMLLARALHIFMPGKPQVWYLDLFVGKNDHEAVERAGAGGHKEINRTNLSFKDVELALDKDIVKKQIALLKFRNTFGAFNSDALISVNADKSKMSFVWEYGEYKASLFVNLDDYSFEIEASKGGEKVRI
jgi:sucrose phosphorylase suc13P